MVVNNAFCRIDLRHTASPRLPVGLHSLILFIGRCACLEYLVCTLGNLEVRRWRLLSLDATASLPIRRVFLPPTSFV